MPTATTGSGGSNPGSSGAAGAGLGAGLGGSTIGEAPAQKGWHLVHFLNGDVGLLQWTGNGWDFGGLPVPSSPAVRSTFLGSNLHDVTHNPSRWNAAITTVSSTLQKTLISAIDHGVFGLQGKPVLFDKNANPIGAQSGQTGSEATPINQIPSPIDPSAGNSHLNIPSLSNLFGSIGLWKGIGLILAGAAILVFAAIEFKNMAGVSVPVPKV